MNTEDAAETPKAHSHPDPLTGEPGAHPVATGLGAASAGLAGGALGSVAGPVGSVVGAVVGAVAGGLGGKAIGEAIDPTVEDAYWREAHPKQDYAAGMEYETYRPAYRAGYEGFSRYGDAGRSFEDSEAELRAAYDESSSKMTWMQACAAARAAWSRLEEARRGSR